MVKRDIKALSDAELLSLSREEPAVFEEIVNRYQRSFVRKAVSILRNEDDAYDAVQDTFVRIYTASGKFETREGASFSSWAYTILINQCYTSYKNKHKRELVSLEFVPELVEVIPDQASIDDLERKYTKDYLLSLISKLPVLLRRVVELHFIDGLPQSVVAKQQGVSNAVVRSRIHRAKKELQKMNLELVYVKDQANG
ncbi:MAG: RNA polymerase sigma factor [Candidatus Taylorbacteria bacterium]|nr:RNA polymerase sigma factor [Candidatus Taylorbacteria bacterium]